MNNTLSLRYPGDIIRLNSTYLAAYDLNHDNATLRFYPTDLLHGQFETVNNSAVVSDFTQQEISTGAIQFVHDGSNVAPSYNITVHSSGIAYVAPTPANISFNPLLLANNQLFINQGESVI